MCVSYRISAVASLLAVAVAVAQEDPKEICKKADAATLAVKAASYKVEVFNQDGESRREIFKGTVLLQNDKEKTETGTPPTRIQGMARSPEGEIPIDITTDGKEVLVVDKAKKLAKRVPVDRMQELDRGTQTVTALSVMREFSHPRPFSDEVNGEKLTLEGKKTINGVECNVILVKYSGIDADARWYFGVKDSLPRRVERLTQRYSVELGDLNVDPKIEAGAFAIKAPEGFEEDAPGILSKGRAAPAFDLQTADGKKVTLESLKGKVVVLAFWSSWNGPAKKALPIVEKLHTTYGAGDKAVVYGVQVWEENDPSAFLKENKYTFPTLVKGDKIAEAYKIEKLPVFFVIGKDGKIRYSAVGIDGNRDAEIAKEIDAATK